MICPFMTMNDGTEIVHSQITENGRVKVYIERPDAEFCFRHATCWLPDYTWEDVHQFSDEDISDFEDIIRSSAHQILESSQTGEPHCIENI